MNKFNLLFALVVTAAFTFTSCKEKAAEGEAATTEATTDATTAADPNAPMTADPNALTSEGAATPVPTGPLTTLTFENDTYDWGKVMDGEKVTHSFKFTNTGKEPLIISNAKGSCGCTVPEWPKDAIAPGKSGEIKVVFDSNGKGAVGGKEDSKRVTITANTDPVETYLTIKGKIDKKAEAGK